MAELYKFFPTGSGANVGESDWEVLFAEMASPGVGRIGAGASSLAVTADGGGRYVRVAAGVLVLFGHVYQNTAEIVQNIGANSSGSTRHDYVVIRTDRAGDTMALHVIQGTPGAGAPALTQDATTYDWPLALIEVGNGVSAIAADKVTPTESRFMLPQNRPGGLYWHTADQSHGNATWALPLTSELSAYHSGIYTNGATQRSMAPAWSGQWTLFGQVVFAVSTAGSVRGIRFVDYSVGPTVVCEVLYPAAFFAPAGGASIIFARTFDLVAGHQYGMEVYQDSGGALTLRGASGINAPAFGMSLVRF